MDKRRKTARLSFDEIPVVLQNPVIYFSDEKIECRIENLSSVGIGLLIDKDIIISKGELFYLKYNLFESEIECLCMFSDEENDRRSIGAYFTAAEDQQKILEYIYVN